MAGLDEELDTEELLRLEPAARIKRLKALQKEKKKAIEEAQRIITQTEEQVKRDELADKVRVPETAQVNIAKLFEGEDIPSLEEAARKELNSDNVSYFVSGAYEAMKGVLERPDAVDMEAVDAIGEKLAKVKYMNPGEEVANAAVAAIGVLYKIRKEQEDA